MKLVNFGSMNIDNTYKVEEFLRPGETKSALRLDVYCGGKGLNQSIAAAKAGCTVWHAALLGQGAKMLKDKLDENGVDTHLLKPAEGKSGHTVIQVDAHGQNCILLYGGVNKQLTKDFVDEALQACSAEDVVLVQNETNMVAYIIEKASSMGMRVAFNASPITEELLGYPFDKVTWLFINEVEGACLTGSEDADEILAILGKRYPQCKILLTLGKHGAVYQADGKMTRIGIFPVPVVDTTSAGDTFTGYFLQAMMDGLSPYDCLLRATVASTLCVQRPGAADSIPLRDEVEKAMEQKTFGQMVLA
jgi:ribokinase